MFQGSMVAMATPMRADGAVDEDALAGLVEFHVVNGTDAIVAVGTTGESATLDFDEHEHVVRRVIELAAGRVPIIAGTGANSTAEAIRLTKSAKDAGADACLLVTPYYNKPTQEGLYRHFVALAEAVDIPQILYNVPGRTAVDMKPETTERLSHVDNIIGIKEAFGAVERIRDLVVRCGERMAIYTGDDATAMESIFAGARGDISVTANVVPKQMHDMCAAALRGDRATAEAIEAQISDLHRVLFLESNPIPVKWALTQMGLMPDGIRLPLTTLAENCHAEVRAALVKAGALKADA
jgi:4-hydroxy-tetrahydrodipicolinate synthase